MTQKESEIVKKNQKLSTTTKKSLVPSFKIALSEPSETDAFK